MESNIKLNILIAVIGLFSVFAAQAQSDMMMDSDHSDMWMVDQAHTSVNFTINHFFSEVTGKFSDFEGEVNFNPDKLDQSNANFTIAVSSINTGDDKRDMHLQSNDFFNAVAYPEMTFMSTSIEKTGMDMYAVHGKLTIRDKTKEVMLPMQITGKMEHPMMKGTTILGVLIDTTINRTDFGVGTGDWAMTMVVGDEVRIRIPMELNQMH